MTIHTQLKHQLRISAFLLIAFSCTVARAGEHDELVGTYSFASPYTNSQVEVVKIEKDSSNYVVYVNQGYADVEWPDRGDIAEAAKSSNYEKPLANAKFDDAFIGLQTNKMAVLKLKKGWKSGPYKTETGYLWLSPMGVLEVAKNR